MKRAWNYIVTMWQPATMFIVGVLLIGGLFVYKIGSLVPGATSLEVAGRTSSISSQAILDDPVNAPYKTARLLARKVHNTVTSERLISGLVAGLSVLLFYLIVRHFCGRYAAGLAAIMYATSTSLLTNGRLATPNILLLMLLGLLACGYHLRFGNRRTRTWFATTIILGLSLYVPGMLYFIIGGAVWQFRAVRRDHKWPKPIIIGACLALLLAMILPLLYGFIHAPHIWREYFGLPAHTPTVIGFIKSFLAVPFGIFVWAPRNPVFRLGRQPLLDGFSSVMLILGCYTLVKRYKLDRLVLLFGIFVAAALFAAISGNYENSFVLLPFIYFCIAIGIGMLLEQWRRTFPFNPLARGLALVVIALAVLVSVNFQSRRYFIAWPHNPDTRAMFTLK